MTAEHFADVDLTDPDWPTVEFVCTGGHEDRCRQWCAEGCEEYCSNPYGDADNQDGHRWGPYLVNGQQSCREVDWIKAVGWRDCGWVDEPDKGDEREITDADLRPGRHRIEIEWTDDDYIWRFPVEASA